MHLFVLSKNTQYGCALEVKNKKTARIARNMNLIYIIIVNLKCLKHYIHGARCVLQHDCPSEKNWEKTPSQISKTLQPTKPTIEGAKTIYNILIM